MITIDLKNVATRTSDLTDMVVGSTSMVNRNAHGCMQDLSEGSSIVGYSAVQAPH